MMRSSGPYRLIKNIPVVIERRLGGIAQAGAHCDRKATGYADLCDGSDTSTNRVIDPVITQRSTE